MKKLILLLTGIFYSFVFNAQHISKGRMMLGGNFSTHNTNNTRRDTSSNYNTSQTNLNKSFSGYLRYGYFVADGWMIGAQGGYSHGNAENKYTIKQLNNAPSTTKQKQSSSGFSGGLFARYYKTLGTSRFAFFGELTASTGADKTKYRSFDENGNSQVLAFPESSMQYINVFIRPGLTYFFNKTIAVEAAFGNVGYSYAKTTYGKDGTSPSSSTIDSGINSYLNFSLSSLSLGINFYFGGKKTS